MHTAIIARTVKNRLLGQSRRPAVENKMSKHCEAAEPNAFSRVINHAIFGKPSRSRQSGIKRNCQERASCSVSGSTYRGRWDQWYGPSGRDYDYDAQNVVESCQVARALKRLGRKLTVQKVLELRNIATLHCPSQLMTATPCNPMKAPCLINIHQDPCERNNLAAE